MPAWRGGFYIKQFKYVGGIKVAYWELWSKVEQYESGELAEATWPCKDEIDGKNLVERLQICKVCGMVDSNGVLRHVDLSA